MRYGHPVIAAAIAQMVARRLHAHPGRAALSAILRGDDRDSANDALFAQLASMRFQPAIRTLPPYFDDPLYIDALRANLGAPARRARLRAASGCC